MPPGDRPPTEAPDKIYYLYTQADRIRRLASRCRSQLIAGLLEDHAQLCERNAELSRRGPASFKAPT